MARLPPVSRWSRLTRCALQILKIGVLLGIFDKKKEMRSFSGTRLAHMAMLAVKEINEDHDILPSYEVCAFVTVFSCCAWDSECIWDGLISIPIAAMVYTCEKHA